MSDLKDNLIKKYIEVCKKIYDLSDINAPEYVANVKKANRIHKKVIEYYKILKEDADLADHILPELMMHDNMKVRSVAASHCLGLNIHIDEAVMVFEEIKKTARPLRSFEAEMTLKVWNEQGYLKIYPDEEK